MTVPSVVLAPAAYAEGVQDQQWWLDGMQMPKVWKASTGEGVTVAVADTGADASTPSLRGQVRLGKSLVDVPGDETKDDNGHGTTVAELIAGTATGTGAGGSLKGLAPDAKILPFRVGLEGIEVLKRGTLGGHDEAVRAAATVASMGNGADVSEFSPYGDPIALTAPGEELPAWCGAERERYWSDAFGTTYSAALASGAAVLVWAKHPKWTANQVLRVLLDTARRAHGDKGTISRYIGYGAVRPRANLLEGKGDPSDPSTRPLTGKKVKKKSTPVFRDRKPSRPQDAGSPGEAKAVNSASDGWGSGLVLPLVGVGAGVVLLAGRGFAIGRLRRN